MPSFSYFDPNSKYLLLSQLTIRIFPGQTLSQSFHNKSQNFIFDIMNNLDGVFPNDECFRDCSKLSFAVWFTGHFASLRIYSEGSFIPQLVFTSKGFIFRLYCTCFGESFLKFISIDNCVFCSFHLPIGQGQGLPSSEISRNTATSPWSIPRKATKLQLDQELLKQKHLFTGDQYKQSIGF